MSLLHPVETTPAPELPRSSWQMLVNGAWVGSSSGEELAVEDPGTGEVIARVPSATIDDADRAVAAARAAFDDTRRWVGLPPQRRAEVLFRAADLLDERASLFAGVESRNQGMPLSMALGRALPDAARTFRYYAGWADKVTGRSSESWNGDRRFHTYTRREPVGVAALVVPWNAPLGMAAWKLAPALAAGCTCILKPAEETPLTALLLAEVLQEAGVPDGVLNVITGVGSVVGARLAEHPDVDKVAFTGSTEVGRAIARAATGNLKKVSLELGGKSPVIVFGDADLERAIPGAAAAIFTNSGQVCTAGSRLFVHESVHDEVVAGIVDIAERTTVGYCTDPRAQMGPLISRRQRDTVMGYVQSGLAEGGSLATGGSTSERGYFVEPTVLVGATPRMTAVREEIFGPVLAVMSFTDTDDVITQANDSPYGLAGSVWTRDASTARTVAWSLRAGRVGINVHAWPEVTMPTGGYKQSGWGRELGPEGLDLFLETKSVFDALD
ncbi:Acyl-CoA reductase [Quadrisphaera granulorum]|uniref:Acyl-CoA reductase-like NAD-dependent aldehyde dehydrogenase n=1 Tax=Quadrisphaera granulorum TaxID=317664 RepID=A0A316ABT7_9ACTN|nr:aldehyde dehydrogenase family protein [Quadrisphaera granulorum]PWJ54334.1 acyl-CoA reductase-like NAD-dependent aldehyde dehydrogenase [Quadrisphaera granulorum]SZE96106.1 Acyl-CoA reductase [Quadrisphaera granulorum]